MTILISGGPGAGKTTLLKELLGAVPPLERIVTIEKGLLELRLEDDPRHPDAPALFTRQANTDGRGAVTARELVELTRRLNPDRVIVGELVEDEALEMLDVASMCKRGSMATIHAHTVEAVLSRLAFYVAKSNTKLPEYAVWSLIAETIDFVIHIDLMRNTRRGAPQRRVTSIVECGGRGETVACAPRRCGGWTSSAGSSSATRCRRSRPPAAPGRHPDGSVRPQRRPGAAMNTRRVCSSRWPPCCSSSACRSCGPGCTTSPVPVRAQVGAAAPVAGRRCRRRARRRAVWMGHPLGRRRRYRRVVASSVRARSRRRRCRGRAYGGVGVVGGERARRVAVGRSADRRDRRDDRDVPGRRSARTCACCSPGCRRVSRRRCAFRRFADDMDDPLADLVAVGLLIAVTRGAETEEVLSALAEQARHQADRRRIVEAERAPMRREVLMVSMVMCALLGGVFLFARELLPQRVRRRLRSGVPRAAS